MSRAGHFGPPNTQIYPHNPHNKALKMHLLHLSQLAALLSYATVGHASPGMSGTIATDWHAKWTVQCPPAVMDDFLNRLTCVDQGLCRDGVYSPPSDHKKLFEECWCAPRREHYRGTGTATVRFVTETPATYRYNSDLRANGKRPSAQ